jgi:hypothetical protein
VISTPSPDQRPMAEVSPQRNTCRALHTIAAHVLGRRRFAASGRFGLRAGPGGIATPAFGDAPETIRIAGVTLIHETAGSSRRIDVNGSTLSELAGFVGAHLDEPFDCGADAPPLGPVDIPFDVDITAARGIADWFWLAWLVLDDVVASLPRQSEVATTQLWPEHFDAATTVTLAPAEPVNLGFSPGDGFEAEPYVYVGPGGPERPGDPSFWNVPFGAMRRRSEVQGATDPAEFCRRFLIEGVRLATS